MSKKNILITGGLGYIGSKFIHQYKDVYNIKVLDTNFYGNFLPEFPTHNLEIKDIRDLSLKDLKNIDYIFHLSELSNDPLGSLNSEVTHEINVLGTKKLIDLCNKSNIKNFIYMSSCSVYGKTNNNFVNENSPTNPITEYAISKIKNEKYIMENNLNFPVTIFRNATVFGYSPNLRLDLVINDLTYSALKNNKINLFSDGTPKRPFIHIQDLVSVVDYFFQKNLSFNNEVINIGNEKLNYSIKEVAYKIGEIIGVTDISFGSIDKDQRSYLVSFDKFKKFIPEFKFNINLDLGIKELQKNLKNYEFSYSSSRLKQIELLKKQNKIDSSLKRLS